MTAEGELEPVFVAAGCRGFVHAVTLDGLHEVGLGADDVVVPASVFKVLVALEAESRFVDGRLDPCEPFRLTDASRSPGPVGIATDALAARVGLDALATTADRLGMASTAVECDLRSLIDSIARDAGFADWAAVEAWQPPGRDEESAVQALIRRSGALMPTAPMRTTPRDMTTLLRLVWTDEAGPPAACERVRFLMTRQVTRDRLARGFGRGTSVAAKSGALFGVVRNEVGVVTLRDGLGVAVAVFTRSEDASADERAVNDAIGEAAAVAVGHLRDVSGR